MSGLSGLSGTAGASQVEPQALSEPVEALTAETSPLACPACQAALGDQDRERGVCPNCGLALGDAPGALESDGSSVA